MPTVVSRSPSVEVCRKTTSRSAAARDGSQSTDSACAGRPFFISTGVSQASLAPASSSTASTDGHSRGSRSSTLVSSTTAVPGAASAVSPSTSRSTFATSSGSRPPAPVPVRRSVIGGSAPQPVTHVASSAAPVGVVISFATGPARTGTPRSSASTAGGGTGSGPCAPRVVPEPSTTGEPVSDDSPSEASPAHAPTTSATASSAPTSWKCTSSTSVRCTPASATASRVKASSARDRTASASGGGLEQRAQVAPGASGRRRCVDVDLGRADAGAHHVAAPQHDRLDADRVDGVLQQLERHLRVDQRAEQHVAAGAGGAVEPADHRPDRRATRAAKTPAPKPLSMFTTATPGAQALSIASSAASPPKEAP